MKKFLSIYLTVMFIFTISPVNGAYAIAAAELFTDGEISGEINVHCYDGVKYKSDLEDAARLFEQKYPGTKVNVSEFSILPNDRSPSASDVEVQYKAASDYITRVNIEMMSGGGADIYAIDVLPVYKYADSGQFVDLRMFMDNDPDFNYGDYHESIFDVAMYNGGQYILPAEFDFYILSYDKNLLDENAKARVGSIGKYTYPQLIDIGVDSFFKYNDAASPIKIMPIPGDQRMFGFQLDISYNVFVDVGNRKANFTDGKFAEILNNAKDYCQKGYNGIANNANFDSLSSEDQLNYILTQSSPKSIFEYSHVYWLLRSLISEEPDAKYKITDGITNDDEIIGLLSNVNGDVPVSIGDNYSMNANSKNKRTAWEFMKFLISEEIQTTPVTFSVAINKNASITNAKTLIYNSLVANRDMYDILPPDAEPDEKQMIILDRYLDYMEIFLPMTNINNNKDVIVSGMIESEVTKFFDGTRTADEVAKILQSRVEMYLQE